jgi:hypothetical protein
MSAESDLLMVHADELLPVLDHAVSSAGAGGEVEGARYEDPEHLWDDSREANDLAAQRWAVIAPEGPEGDAMLGRIERLIAHRQAQQEAPVKIYRVPPGMPAADAAHWRKQVFEPPGVRRRDLPRYQLVLGDLHQVSADLQVIQGSTGFVGRLAFDRLEDYEAYVDKLLRWEGTPAPVSRARAVFHTVKDRTSATTTGHQCLMVPGLALARRYHDEGDFPASAVLEVDHGYTPKPGPLLEEAIKDEPGVLLTMSHGAGAPRSGWRSGEQQRLVQGGMSFGPAGGLLTGEALAGRPFMPGGVWLMLACFGAGTPERSKYQRWLEQLAATGSFMGSTEAVGASLPADGRPFTAAVPKAVLASPQGPLAFIGHVDLAWTYSFRERDTGTPVDRPERFIDVLHGLLRRDRAGVAFAQLLRHYGQTNTDLTMLLDSGADEPDRLGHLWMLRNDLAGYMLLGDPAVRLPLQEEAKQADAPFDPYAALGLGGPSPRQSPQPGPQSKQESSPAPRMTAQQPEPAGALPSGVDADALERAIGLYLLGELGVAKILQECGLSLGRREFEDLARRYAEAGRRALGL